MFSACFSRVMHNIGNISGLADSTLFTEGSFNLLIDPSTTEESEVDMKE